MVTSEKAALKELRKKLKDLRQEQQVALESQLQALLAEAQSHAKGLQDDVKPNIFTLPRTTVENKKTNSSSEYTEEFVVTSGKKNSFVKKGADKRSAKKAVKKIVVIPRKHGGWSSDDDSDESDDEEEEDLPITSYLISHTALGLDSREYPNIPRSKARQYIHSVVRTEDNPNMKTPHDPDPKDEAFWEEIEGLYKSGNNKEQDEEETTDERDEEIHAILEYWQQSDHKDLEQESIINILIDLFPMLEENRIRHKFKSFVQELSGHVSPDKNGGEDGEKANALDGETEIEHETLAGKDRDYLRVIDVPRLLYCQRCKLYDCNLHLMEGKVFGKASLQLQYEVAMEDEKRRKPVLRKLPTPLDLSAIPERSELSPFQKAICRRVFLIYQGDTTKVALVINAPKRLVDQFCRSFVVPTERDRKLVIGAKDMSKSYKVGSYPLALYMRNTAPGLRESFVPCVHEGPCTEGECSCIDNGQFCTKACCWGRLSVNFFRGCQCNGPCQSSCTCFKAHRECDPDICSCDTCTDPPGRQRTKQICRNDNITMRRKIPTLVAQSEIPGAGLGLFSRHPIKKNQYINEYVGELVSHDEAERRGRQYDFLANTSLFDLCEDTALDANKMCNEMRFVNYSKQSNIEPRTMRVNGDYRIGFYAVVDIPAQTELLFDYGEKFRAGAEARTIPASSPVRRGRKRKQSSPKKRHRLKLPPRGSSFTTI